MGKFINPFTDMGFKMIFGQEVNKSLLIDFLNNLLEGERVITDVQFLDKEQLPSMENERGLIYDVYCKTDTDERIIIEMQNRWQLNFKDRALLYLSRSIVEQGKRGTSGRSYAINAVYGVFFMNFKEVAIGRDFRTDIALMDMRHKSQFSDKLRMIFLQLPEFRKEADECENYFERWIFVLKNMDILERMPWAAQYAAFKKLSEICEMAALTPQERSRYEESIKVYRDNIAIAERDWMEGKAAGLAEGKAAGLAEGKAAGLAEGKAAGLAEVAKNLKEMGLPLPDISKATGLTEAEIEAL